MWGSGGRGGGAGLLGQGDDSEGSVREPTSTYSTGEVGVSGREVTGTGGVEKSGVVVVV